VGAVGIPSTATLGLLAPSVNVQEARARARESEAQREGKRERSRLSRDSCERRYRQQFAEAVFRFLDFAPDNRELARQIADGTAAQATVVSSGRVGRTTRLKLEEKAELAARAYIRHRHTGFEDNLMEQGVSEVDDSTYREAKAEAHREIEAFLRKHRSDSSCFSGPDVLDT
jgi:hypothetical protein